MRARQIVRYSNRRLYDRAESRYITLVDLHKLVLQRVDFVVRDRNSKTDITITALLQIILEQQQAGKRMFTRPYLERVIRARGRKC